MEEVGEVIRIGNGQIVLGVGKILEDMHLGDSIAVNGICLTVTGFDAVKFAADVMPETLRRTSLQELGKGSSVNLERALSLSGRLGGHIVSGHIDGVGRVEAFQEEKNAVLMKVSAERKLLRYVVEKGSVALDGISLTVAEVTGRDFTVSLIPHTRTITNLGGKHVGSPINIETDLIGKYVEKLLLGEGKGKSESMGITKEFLWENGF